MQQPAGDYGTSFSKGDEVPRLIGSADLPGKNVSATVVTPNPATSSGPEGSNYRGVSFELPSADQFDAVGDGREHGAET